LGFDGEFHPAQFVFGFFVEGGEETREGVDVVEVTGDGVYGLEDPLDFRPVSGSKVASTSTARSKRGRISTRVSMV
jgi:hypothetical protein